jgi:riboflavin synthase
MFTGIIGSLGEVLDVEEKSEGLRRVTVAADYEPESIAIGDSIACAGICLTIVDRGRKDNRTWFAVDAAAETLRVTTAASWRRGTRLNLERALRFGDQLGGHLITGHVDSVAELIARQDLSQAAKMSVRAPSALGRFIAPKGSVALDGVSLTVNEVDDDAFSVLIIPHTLQVTTLGSLAAGARLNLEVDLMARYAARLSAAAPGATLR